MKLLTVAKICRDTWKNKEAVTKAMTSLDVPPTCDNGGKEKETPSCQEEARTHGGRRAQHAQFAQHAGLEYHS